MEHNNQHLSIIVVFIIPLLGIRDGGRKEAEMNLLYLPFIYRIINILYKMQVVLGSWGAYLEKR